MTVTKKSVYTYADLNKDLNDLYMYVKNENYSDKEIKTLIKPLISKLSQVKISSRLLHLMLGLLFVVSLVYLLTYWEIFYWNLTALTRIFLIKILSVYDWKHLKNANCFIEKYSFQELDFDEKFAFDCDLCESIMTFDELTYYYDTEDRDYIENLIKIDRPVIIRGGIEDWIHESTKSFIDLLLNDNDFATSIPCKLKSNIHNRKEDFIEARNLISKTFIFDSFFLQFQNCEKPAIRIFRNVTSRPSLLPDTLSPVTLNWLLWSNNYNTTRFKKIDLMEKYTVIGQMEGGIILRLLPRKNCQNVCQVLEGPLFKNQFVVLTSLWDVEYKPFEEGENLGAILEIRG